MRIAIVHDWLNQNGGAERVLEALHDLYPDAPIYTSLYDPARVPRRYADWDIRTSFMQRFPLAKARHQAFLPFFPLAFRSFDFSGYDLVISNSSGFAHSIRVPPGTKHINYCLTPPRFLWMPGAYLARERVPARRALLPLIVALRRYDARSVRSVTRFVAISEAVRDRIRRWYGREADIVYPPVQTDLFRAVDRPAEYYFVAARLVPYKRVDLPVRAFSELKLPLIVAGDGRDGAALRAMAGPTVKFTGWVSHERLIGLMARCKAFVFPAEEDFGIAPLEAGACGRPVIAYAAGGALETVVEGLTGVFFHEPSPASLSDAVRRFEGMAFDPAVIRRHAEGFDSRVFHERFASVVQETMRSPGPVLPEPREPALERSEG